MTLAQASQALDTPCSVPPASKPRRSSGKARGKSAALHKSSQDALATVPVVAHPAPTWPVLASLGLSGEAVAARRTSIGGSDANVILSGDVARIARLWREKRGMEEPKTSPTSFRSCSGHGPRRSTASGTRS